MKHKAVQQSLIAALVVAGLVLLSGGCGGGGSEGGNLQEFGAIQGLITLPTGEPVAGIVVVAEKVENGLTPTVSRALHRRSSEPLDSAPGYHVTQTDLEGSYQFSNLPVGDYVVSTQKPSVGAAVQQNVVVRSRQTTVVNLELTPTGRISGTITREGAEDHSFLIVAILGTSYMALTDADGNYTLSDVPVGTYTVSVLNPDNGRTTEIANVEVTAGQTTTGVDGSVSGAPSGSRAYVGSERCKTCHEAIYNEENLSGHPWKLNRVINGQPPDYPFSNVPNPPVGFTWDDISYVIGGFGWKARFIDQQGYIITGDEVQYNLATQGWVAYHAEDPLGTKPYGCGQCHTTGWVATGPDGPHQDGLPGMHGTFSEPGIRCEACHGPGSHHVVTQSANDINLDTTKELCGTCHFRDSLHRIAAKGGFIRHHEQFDEMISAGHVALDCVDCHDPHKSARYEEGGPGITVTCESCHPDKADHINHLGPEFGGPDCEDCHLPQASKSAGIDPLNPYVADVKTHIFKIHPEAVGKDAMWYEENGGTFAHGFVTLDFVCYQCHRDVNGEGGPNSPKTLAELAARAEGIHD